MRDDDYNDAIEFLRKFFQNTEHPVELRAFRNKGGATASVFTRDPDEVVEYCKANDIPGWGVYFGVATRAGEPRGGGREFLRELPALWGEIDIHKFGMTEDAAVAILVSCPLPPSVIVFSGRGLHVYWLLREPYSVTYAPFGVDAEKERVERINRNLARIFHGDINACDVTRVLRPPGTHNSKQDEYSVPGGTPVPVRIVTASWVRYELEEVEEFAAECRVLIESPAAIQSPNNPPNKGDADAIAGATSEDDPFLDYAQAMSMDIEGELAAMRLKDEKKPLHWTRMRVAGSLVARGHPDDVIFERLMAETERVVTAGGEAWTPSRERFETKRLNDEIRGAHQKGYAPQRAEEPELPAGVVRLRPGQQQQDRPDDDPLPHQPGTAKPTVPVRAGHLSEIATQGEQVLLAVAAPFYSRSGRLMRPVIDEAPGADGGTTKIARLVDVTSTAMVDYLARVANWVKYEKRSKTWNACDPPKLVAEIILSRDGEWKLPPVVGVITTPTLRPDGSILREEGYDPATRLVLLSPPRLPVMPPQPSREDAVAALNLLLDLLTDFSFTDEASRSVALSALITPVVRGAMPVAPCHVMRAPVAGSGKSYLIDISSAISSGQRCPVIAAGKGEEEMEKRLGAALISGQAIVSIDNLNGELKGDALCQMVERPLVQIRLLGQSVLMLIETRATVFATGNNIIIVGDMVRRTLLASMDAELERPELRQFDKKPLNMVLADRGKYITACLTLVRAYQQAGYPNPCPALASYEKWSLTVRSALVWLGQADPVDTMENTRAEDPELAALREVVSGWFDAGGLNTPRTVRQIIALSEMTEQITKDDENDNNPYAKTTSGDYLNPEFREALQAVAPGPKGVDPRRLGMWLSRQKNRIIDGLKIEGKPDGHSNVVKWSLVSVRREGEMRG